MPYVCNLGTGQKIYLDNGGEQTSVTLVLSVPGQQQQSSQQFQTGAWTHLPQVFQAESGTVIKLMTVRQGDVLIQVQGQSMQVIQQWDRLSPSQPIQISPLETMPEVGTSMQPMEPMKPMQPMKSMKMGDMQMRMNPMQMQMGDMQMQMGKKSQEQPSSSSSEQHTVSRRFCTQCGQPVKPEDRFCASCGHALS